MARSPLFDAVSNRYRAATASGDVGYSTGGYDDSSLPGDVDNSQSEDVYNSEDYTDEEKGLLLKHLGDPRADEFEEDDDEDMEVL